MKGHIHMMCLNMKAHIHIMYVHINIHLCMHIKSQSANDNTYIHHVCIHEQIHTHLGLPFLLELGPSVMWVFRGHPCSYKQPQLTHWLTRLALRGITSLVCPIRSEQALGSQLMWDTVVDQEARFPILSFVVVIKLCFRIPTSFLILSTRLSNPNSHERENAISMLSADGAEDGWRAMACRAWAALTRHGVLVARPQDTYLIKGEGLGPGVQPSGRGQTCLMFMSQQWTQAWHV